LNQLIEIPVEQTAGLKEAMALQSLAVIQAIDLTCSTPIWALVNGEEMGNRGASADRG